MKYFKQKIVGKLQMNIIAPTFETKSAYGCCIKVSNASNGIYLLQITTAENTYNTRIAMQK